MQHPLRLRWLAVFVLLCATSPFPASGCGVTTHNVIARRATGWFQPEFQDYSDIITAHQHAFQAGAAFPDWGYNCEILPFLDQLPDASETAHWEPFQRASAQHMREKYGSRPWNQEGQQFVAFLLGLVSHSVADVLWHNLGRVTATGQGFIQALADANYNAHLEPYHSDAHTEADVGGEFMCAYEVDLSFLDSEWHIPSEDLANVYKLMGGNFSEVTANVIDICMSELYLEVQAIRYLPSELLYPHFAAKAPFLVEQFQTWWLGGVNDMAAWTTKCWEQTQDWLENGPSSSSCAIYNNDTYSIQAAQKLHMEREKKSHRALREKLNPYLENIHLFTDKSQFGTVLKSRIRHKTPLVDALQVTSCLSQTETAASVSYEIDTTLALLGSSVASGDFNADGMEDIAISAPSYSEPGLPQIGAVFVIDGGTPLSGHQKVIVNGVNGTVGVKTIHGTIPNARMGLAMTSLDFNLDTYSDLVVAIPGTDAWDLQYNGIIQIYFGSSKGIEDTPAFTIVAKQEYTNLGVFLSIGDVDGDSNDDLLVGSPFAESPSTETGELCVFLSSAKRKHGDILDLSAADWSTTGESDFEWFGYHAAVAATKEYRYLVVGAPYYNNGTDSVGKIYGFDISHFNETKEHKALLNWTITGEDVNGKLGFSFDFGEPLPGTKLIAASLPTKSIPPARLWDDELTQAGSVILFSLGGLHGKYTVSDILLFVEFLGDEAFSHLGWVVKYSSNVDGTSDLIITVPLKDRGVLPSSGDAGAVYKISGGPKFPQGIITDVETVTSECTLYSAGKSLFGRSLCVVDWDRDGENELLVGAPRASTLRENAGTATLLWH